MRIYFTFILLLQAFFSFAQVIFTSSDLPIVKINTNNADIPDDPKIAATMEIINHPAARNNVSDAADEFNGAIGIEVRGESSQGFPMKSYSIEIRDANGKDMDQSLFGMQAESDWVLYAPYTDKTLMRNVLAYNFSNAFGHWAPHTKFVEVVLNGEYIGVYVFLEKIKRKRVNIKKLEAADSTGDKVTGGYIFAIDKEPDAWYSSYTTPNSNASIHFKYIYPKPKDIIDTQKNYIKSYVDSFENALAGADFTDPQKGFRKFADDKSFIDYFLVNEVSRNVDGYRLSTYLNKDQNSVNAKIKAGPVWDYDIAFRNANYCNGSDSTGWAYKFNDVCANDGFQVPFWWNRLMEDSLFQSDLLCRWTVLRQTTLSNSAVDKLVDSVSVVVNEAQQRHFTKWPVLGTYVWPNADPIPATYSEELTTLKAWLANRLAWIDNNIARVGPCGTTLAVNDNNLKVVRQLNNALLTWQTSTASTADHFVVERSLDGAAFNAFAQVNASGNNSPGSYTVSDNNIDRFDVSKIYYRLRSVGKSGDVKIGNIVSLAVVKGPLNVVVFPNPVKENLNLILTSDEKQNVQIIISNSVGQNIITEDKTVTNGANQLNYNSSSWADGVYIIRVIAKNGNNVTARFVK